MAEVKRDKKRVADAVKDSICTPSAKKKRGPYKRCREKYTKEQPENYFREEHEFQGHFVTWADAYKRGEGCVTIVYKISGEKKQFRAPRKKAIWLDDDSLDFAKREVTRWKNTNNNALGKGHLIPDFYLDHRVEYIKWLNNTAKHVTIEGYEEALIKYVFPFFVDRLKLDRPSQWDGDSIIRWESLLVSHNLSQNTRNRKRTALRRYLRFLKGTGRIKNLPMILNEPVKRRTRETVIPGDLPEWGDVEKWLRGLQPGRYRFIMVLCAAFGVRISEACAVEEFDFLGLASNDHIDSKKDYIKKIKDSGLGALFLYIHQAKKKKIKEGIIKILGEPDDSPKTGAYTACCTHGGLAELIVEMIEAKEHLGGLTKDEIMKSIAKLPVDHSPYKFHEYRSHDYRRLNITLQSMDLDIDNNVEICCQTHGHSSREMFFRYYQWGLMQRRKQHRSQSKLVPFKIKKA